MPNLISHLKKVSEQKPQATYYNVDMLKYQVKLLKYTTGVITTFHLLTHCSCCLLYVVVEVHELAQRNTMLKCGRIVLTQKWFPAVSLSGVFTGPPVHSSEPGSELAVWAHQHWPENRLQIQRRGHDHADGAQQCPVPRPGRRRGFQTTGCLTSCCMVQFGHVLLMWCVAHEINWII